MNRITISLVSTANDVNALTVATRALIVGVGRASSAAVAVIDEALCDLVRGVARLTARDGLVLSAACRSLAVGVGQWLVAEVQRRR